MIITMMNHWLNHWRICSTKKGTRDTTRDTTRERKIFIYTLNCLCHDQWLVNRWSPLEDLFVPTTTSHQIHLPHQRSQKSKLPALLLSSRGGTAPIQAGRLLKNRSDPFESDNAVSFSTINNESGYSSRVDHDNFVKAKENFPKGEHSNDASDKSNTDPFYLFKRKKKLSLTGEDKLHKLSDEMILMIMESLPKKCLVRSMSVCKRWYRIACDEALWTRLDLGSEVLNEGRLGHILQRGIQILRLAQAEIVHPALLPNSNICFDDYTSKLQHLDLSMAVVTINSLADIMSMCKYLKKLFLEKCTLNEKSCKAIGNNEELEILNLTICEGINMDCVKYIIKLKRLTGFNKAWCQVDSDCMGYLCKKLLSSMTRLNIAGYRKSLTDDDVVDLIESCPHLIELDLSDCTVV